MDDWDNLITAAAEGGTLEPLARQMVQTIRELGAMCEWADQLFEGDAPDEPGYNWRSAWKGLNV